MRTRRGYSRQFTPAGSVQAYGKRGRRYSLDNIPAGFWDAVRAEARRQSVSVRSLILTLLTQWLHRHQPMSPAAREADLLVAQSGRSR